MQSKVGKKVTYDVEVKCPTLGIDKTVAVDEAGLRKVYEEVDQLCAALADALGDVRLPTYRTQPPHPERPPAGAAASRLLEFAEKVTDFTIKGASENLGIPYATLYSAATKLETDGFLMKTQVAGGIADLYKLKSQPKAKEIIPALEVLPAGKVPFPDRLPNPEAEKIKKRADRY